MKPKTRSNILASILQNPTLLEEAYEQSKNSQGVGQRELDVYLDSIEAKLTILKNSLSELAFNTIDSEGFKTLLDIINSLIGAVNTLVKTFGGLETILGSIAGIVMQRNGLGLIGNKNGPGILSVASGFAQNTKRSIKNLYTPKINASKETSDFYFPIQGGYTSDYGNSIPVDIENGELYNGGGLYIAGWADDTSDSLQQVTESISDLGEAVPIANASVLNLSGIFSKIIGVGSKVVSTFGSIALAMAAMFVVQKVVQFFIDLARAEEIAIEKGKEAKSSIQNAFDGFKDAKKNFEELNKTLSKDSDASSDLDKQLENIGETYEKLSAGVNSFTNANETLTTDEYQQYLDISNELANQYPELVKGYDAQGNAILNLADDVENAATKLKDMYHASMLVANVKIATGLQDNYDGVKTQIKQYEEDIDKLEEKNDELKSVNVDEGKISIPTNVANKDKLLDVLSGFGVDTKDVRSVKASFNGEYVDYYFEELKNYSEDQISELNDSLWRAFGVDNTSKINANNQQISAIKLLIKDQWKSLQDSIGAYLQTSDAFTGINQELQSAILGGLANINLEPLKNEYNGDIMQFIYGTLIQPLNDLTPKIQNQLVKVFKIPKDKMSAIDYTTSVYNELRSIFGNDQIAFDWFDKLGFVDLAKELVEKRNKIIDSFGKKKLSEEDIQSIMGLSIPEIDTAISLLGEKTYTSFETLRNEISKKREINPQDTLFDIFNDASYKEKTEEYEKKLSSLSGALKTIREEGTLTAEAMRDLQEEFPNLTDFTTEGIGQKAQEELKAWITELRQGYDGLTDEGKKQIDVYTENLERSYGDLYVNEETATRAVRNQFLSGATDAIERQMANAQTTDIIQQLKDKYKDDLNWQLVWELALEDKLSPDADATFEAYDGKVVTWELELEMEESQRELDILASQRDLNSAQNAIKEAEGYDLSAEDYDADNALSEQMIEWYQTQLSIAEQKMEDANDEAKPAIQKKINDLLKSIAGEEATIIKNNKEKNQIPLTQLQNQAELIGLDQDSTKDAISRAEKRGKEITKAQYEAAIEAEKANKDNLRRQHRELIETQQELIASGDNTADNELWRVNQKAIQENEKAYEDAKDAIDDYSKSIENIPLSHLQNSLKDIDRELELDQREIDNPKKFADQSDYLAAMQDNADKMTNLELEIAEKLAQRDTSWDENSEKYQTWKSELQDLEDQLYNTTTAQDEFKKSLMNVPVEDITREIESYENELAKLQAKQDYRYTTGQYETAEDIDQRIELNKQMASKTKGMNTLYGVLEAMAIQSGDEKWLKEIQDAQTSNIQEYYGYRTDIFNDQMKKRELPITEATRDLEKVKVEAQDLQNQFDEIARSGRDATAADYEGLITNAQSQIDYLETIQKENEAISKMDIGPELQARYAAAAVEASSSIGQLNQQIYDWEEAQKQTGVTEQVNEYNDLQREATLIENELDKADQKHQKTSERLYDKLIKNGEKQIKSLQKQREEYKKLQDGVAYGGSKWREYQQQIDSINDSIDGMQTNQQTWLDTMSSLVSTNAAELSSALTTAFSEINSETGLTIETMNELERQFSDLEGHDVSKIFYQSADGMKFNVDAAEELVDAEYELQTNNLESAIAKQEEVVRKLGDSESETAQRAVRAANDRISSYNRELAMLQALYDQQKQQFSNYAQWQTAQQTENAGAHYEDLQGYLKTQNEAYNKGLTGTDEFRAYTEYFDQWGMDTVAAWERNKEKVKRYLTEDSSGLTNFMNDLVGKGLATKDADGMFTLNLKDQQAAADTMGMSKEWFNDMVSRSEDYGFINTWVDSELDGRLQLQEQTEKLVEEQLKLNQAMRDGASQEVIDNQQAYIDEIKETIRGITEATNIVKEADSKITSTQIQDSISNINAMRDLITPDMSKEQVDLINNAITEYAASHHIILEPDVELNSFKINEDAMQKAFPEYDINLKPNWDALEEAINGKPKTIEELTDGILNPVQLQSAMEQQTDTLLSSAAEKVKAGWDENDEALQGYLQTLQGVDREVLNNIKISNKGYDVEEKYHGVEDALQGIADMFGITQEEGTKLVEILELIGAFKPEQTYDAPKLINEDGSINLVAGAQKVGDKVTGLFKTAGDEIKHQMEQAQYEKESEPVTTAIADQTTTVTGFLGDIVGGIGDVVSVLQTGNTTKEQPVVGNTQTNTNSPTKPNDNKPQNAYTDTGTGDRDNVMSILAQRELENAQKQQYEDQSQPVVNALSDLSQQVSSGDSDIVNAVNSLPEAIVAATNKPTVENPVTVNPVQPGDKSEQTQPQQATTTETKPLSSVTSYYGTDTGTVVKTVEYKPETGEIEQTEKEIQNKPIQQEVDLKVESSAPQSGQTITNTVTADTSSAEKSIDRLAHMEKMSQQIDITAADKTDEGVDSANNSVETKIKDKTINLGANDNITSTANQAQGSINSLTGKTVSVDVDINGLTDLNKAKREIQEMKDKRIEVTTVMRKETKVLGTATVSHASGTAYGMWESYRHSIGAYANGSSEDWELKQNEQALVNEFAPNHPESIVRDGKWMIIPGGPHVEQLKKGDIIFNAQQTDDLIRTGRTAHAGKIAYSTGTAYNMINAHATRTTTAGGTRGSIGGNSANTHQKTGGLSNNNNALKANTDQLKKNKNQSGKDTKKVTTAIDKFKKYFENLKDWIEVRLQRRDEAIELNLTKNENATKYQKKNSFVSNAEEQNKLKTNTAKRAIKEYEDQAQKVKKIALKTGLIPNTKKGKDRADDLYNKVMNGDLSIEEMKGLIDNNTGKAISSKKKKDAYTSKELTYVEALTEWIDKMYQAQQTLEECKQKAKELAQTRLDNITEQFETLAGYAQSVIAVSDSMMALTTARGRTAVNDEAFKKEYRTQMTQQNYTTGYLRAELKAYDKEMEHALEVFGRDSNEYHQALTKQNEIQQAINESEQKYYDMRKQAAELEFTYISQIIDRIKAVQQTINGRISLAQARNNKYAQNGGESENTSFYEKLYGNLAATNNGLITEWKAQYDEAVKYIGEHQLTDENAEEYQDYYNRAIQAEQEIYSILQDQESVKKNLRDLRWKSFNDLQKTIQETISDLDALRDTMRDAEFFDSEYGIDITDKGYANLQLLGQSIQQAKQQIKDYRVALEKLDKEYKNGNITVEEYNNLSREYTEQIQDSAKAVAQDEDSIVNMYTTMIQNENQLLQDNINKRKEALQTKKQYYDWDKQIKDKNKDIVQLQAQLNALQGVFICPYLSNCWKTLKTNKPQHKDETCLSVMV